MTTELAIIGGILVILGAATKIPPEVCTLIYALHPLGYHNPPPLVTLSVTAATRQTTDAMKLNGGCDELCNSHVCVSGSSLIGR
jgi:hypothetical protein